MNRLALLLLALSQGALACGSERSVDPPPWADAPEAPELEGGLAWVNSDAPIRLADLQGHVVLLDFWTYGCINCLHMIPVLAELEEALAGEPFVVLGVHSGKFETEKAVGAVLQAVERYGLHHPVVVDSEFAIWDAYEVGAWPTFVVIDAKGRIRSKLVGERSFDQLYATASALLEEARVRGELTDDPRVLLGDPNADKTDPLLFPGEVLALPDGRWAVADTGHHRVVVVGADDRVEQIYGSGVAGLLDGAASTAAFARPNGMALMGGTLYVADTDNHAIRALDLDGGVVSTVAGTGDKGAYFHLEDGWLDGPTTALRSPWDLEPAAGGDLVVALAGSHQIGLFDPDEERVKILSGRGNEALWDGAAGECAYNQPSGLAASADGQTVYIADAEASAIRALNVSDGSVTTLVGEGLFSFGDVDGQGDEVRLQHPVGVEVLDSGLLLVADSYNDKLKYVDPEARTSETADWSTAQGLDEPTGLSRLGDTVLIADTNNQRVLRHDLATGETSVVTIEGLDKPVVSAE